MSVAVEIDRKNRVVVTRYSGHVTDADVRRQVELIEAGGPYRDTWCTITDFTDVTNFDVATETIRTVAGRASPLGTAKRVMVAPRDVEFGISRMFQVLSEKTRPDITVVRTLTEAYKVLKLPPPEAA